MRNQAKLLFYGLLVLGISGCAEFLKEEAPAPKNPLFSGLYDGGQAALTYATEFPASSATEAAQRGDQAWQAGNLDRALYQYVRALELDPNAFQVLYKIGKIHAQRGNFALAERVYRLVLAQSPRHAGSLEGVGLILLDRRAYDEAAQLLHKSLEEDPGRWQAHNALGIIADLKDDHPGAARHYRAALAVLPNSPQLLNNLGYSKYLTGDWNGARAAFQKALAQNQNYQMAWRNLGLVYTRLRLYAEALDAFQHVMSTAEAYNNVGYLCMLTGDYATAETFLREAVSQAPSYYPVAQENLNRLRILRH